MVWSVVIPSGFVNVTLYTRYMFGYTYSEVALCFCDNVYILGHSLSNFDST